MKHLADIAICVPESVAERGYLKLLCRDYKHDKRRQIEAIHTELYELLAYAASIIAEVSDTQDRLAALLISIQTFISMSDFDKVEIKNVKDILRKLADLPDDQFRGTASLKHIERFVEARDQSKNH